MRKKLGLFIVLLGFSNGFFGQGTVSGKICFPSYYIPEMIVYLRNVKTEQMYMLAIKENQNEFEFREVPIGKYVVYAYTKDSIMSDGYENYFKGSGAYTQFVPCGLSIECEDHTMIEFEVKNKQTITRIDICDWYGAIVPTED